MSPFSQLLILILTVKLSVQQQQVKIGAIFFEDEIEVENGFSSAINHMNSKLNDIKLLPIKRYAPSNDDSIILQKLVCELISSGVAAIFGPSSKASSDIVALIANDTGIPHLTYDWSREETPAERDAHMMTVNVAPPLAAVSRAYGDILSNYGWKTFTIVHESDEGLLKLQDVMQLRRLHREEVKILKFSRGDDYRVLWKNIRQTGERRVVLDCPPDIIQDVINASIYFNMTTQFYHVLLTDLDTHEGNLHDLYSSHFKTNLSAVRVEFDNINFLDTELLKPSLIFDAVQLYALSLKSLLEFQPFFEPRMQCDRLRYGERWMLGKHLLRHMRKTSGKNETFITQEIHLNEYGERGSFSLEVYRPMGGAIVGIWNPQDLLNITSSTKRSSSSSSSKHKMDITDIRPHYRVATRVGTPYLMVKEPEENEILLGNQRYVGYAVDLVHKLSIQDDFDYTIEVVEDNHYGNYNPETREWNGIVRYLIDGKADIGICDLTITQARRSVVDFTVPFMSLGIRILFYKSQPEPKGLFEFMSPFAFEVWIYMGTAYLIVCMIFVFLTRFSAEEWENPQPCNPEPEELENKWCLNNTIWLTMGSLMGQGCDILPRASAMRVINGMWWFFALMMLNSYTANLAAFLTSSRIENAINGIDDLVQQNKIKFGTLSGGSTSNFFKDSNDTVYRLAWSKMIQAQPTVFTKDNNEGVEMVIKNRGTYAFLMETTSLEYNVERNCDLMPVGNQIGEKHYGIAVPLGAEYRSNLSVAILKLSEKGELYELKKKWWKENTDDCGPVIKEDDGADLSVEQLGGVFLVLVLGLTLAYLVGIAEFFWNIQRIAVEERISPHAAFKREGLFVLKFWITRKPNKSSKESDSPDSLDRASIHTFNSHK